MMKFACCTFSNFLLFHIFPAFWTDFCSGFFVVAVCIIDDYWKPVAACKAKDMQNY